MRKFLALLLADIAGLWVGAELIPGVKIQVFQGSSSFFGIPLTAEWQVIILLGVVLALLDFFLKPVLKAITFPLRMLTLGFISLLISIGIIWLLDLLFAELTIMGIIPLFVVSVIIWGLSVLVFFFVPAGKR